MLVLTRRRKESITINGNIRVTFISSHQGSIKLGIEAPDEVSVHRTEVFDRIQNEKECADGHSIEETQGQSSEADEG